MPPESQVGSAAEWLRRAKSNLIRAQQPRPEGVCWNVNLPEDVLLAASLSDYAVAARYPGPMEPVTEEEYQEAVSLAEAVLRWVDQLV